MLNSIAIDLMKSGQPAPAFRTFRSAIQAVGSASCHPVVSGNVNKYQQTGIAPVCLLPRCQKVELPSTTYVSPVPSNEETLSHVYKFSSAEGQPGIENTSGMSVEALVIYSIVLIFNCATCLHRSGSDQGLLKAAGLYMQCLQLLEPLSSSDACDELLGSVLRNQAHLFYSLNDYTSVRCIMDKLFLVRQRRRLSFSTDADATIAPEA